MIILYYFFILVYYKMLIVKCPHCNESVIIEQINCAIFRHGVYKINNDQIITYEEGHKLWHQGYTSQYFLRLATNL
jgi:hypothetical protein